MPNPAHPSDLSTSAYWKEYAAGDLGERVDLTAVEGAPPRAARKVMLLATGAISLENAVGEEIVITTAIMATNATPILVLW